VRLINHDAAPGTTGDYFGFITCGHGVGTGVQYKGERYGQGQLQQARPRQDAQLHREHHADAPV